MTDPTTSKKLLWTSLLLAALVAGGCDDKSANDQSRDVAELGDTVAERTQAQNEAGDDQAQADDGVERTNATSPGGATVAKEAPIDASLYLPKETIEKFAGGRLKTEPLAGKKVSPEYGAARMFPTSKQAYGAGLQLWKLEDDNAAEEMVQRMRGQYLGVKDAPKDAPMDRERAFLSSRAGITTYVFAAESEKDGYVAAVSCDLAACPQGWRELGMISHEVLERIRNPEKLEAVREARLDRTRPSDQERKEREKEKRREKLERRKKAAEKRKEADEAN